MVKYIDTDGVSHLAEKIDKRIAQRRGIYVVPHGAVTWDSNTEFHTETTDESDDLLNAMRYTRLALVIETMDGNFITLYEYQRADDSTVVNFKSAFDGANTYLHAAMDIGGLYAQVIGEIRTDIADGLSDVATLKNEMSTKANLDGSYDDMTAGNAKQVLGTVGVEDQTPYGFRTAGGAVDIGDRENVKAIVGGTIVWNQLLNIANGTKTHRGITASIDSEGFISLSGTSTATYAAVFDDTFVVTDHVYARTLNVINNPNNVSINVMIGSISWAAQRQMKKSTSSGAKNIIITCPSNTSLNGIKIKANVFDLTQIFGSTIADYIYSLEQATSNAGVAWFRSLFPNDYYEYNAGELMSVRTSAHNMVGFNAYDPETGKAKVVGGNQYQIAGSYTSLSLDGAIITPDTQGLFTPPTNGELIVVDGNATDTCIHLVWSGYRNGEYEEYALHSYPLDSDLELRGIPKLDASNNLYYDGDAYVPDGTVTRCYGIRAYQSGDESLSDAITDGTNTVYKLATPTTETAEPYQETQVVNDFGTEEYVDNAVEQGLRDVLIPVGSVTVYLPNLRDKLQNAPNNPPGSGLWVVQRIDGANVYIPLATALQMINNGEDPTEEAEA